MGTRFELTVVHSFVYVRQDVSDIAGNGRAEEQHGRDGRPAAGLAPAAAGFAAGTGADHAAAARRLLRPDQAAVVDSRTDRMRREGAAGDRQRDDGCRPARLPGATAPA